MPKNIAIPAELEFEGDDANSAASLVHKLNSWLRVKRNYDSATRTARYSLGYHVNNRVKLYIKQVFQAYWLVSYEEGGDAYGGKETIVILVDKTSPLDIQTYLS